MKTQISKGKTLPPGITTEILVETFFRLERVEDNKQIYLCICGELITQQKGKGSTNLQNHILSNKHQDYKTICEDYMRTKKESLGVVIKKEAPQTIAQTIFGWMEWIIMDNNTFNFCESELTLKYTNLQKISTELLIQSMHKVYGKVIQVIREILPEKFPVIFDGWDNGNGKYFVGMYAVIIKDETIKYILLAIQPLCDGTFTAEAHVLFMEETLMNFGKHVQSISVLIGDNCNVNKCIADRLGVPLLGCASHRLNLAVKLFLRPHDGVLEKVHQFMTKLSTKKRMGKLCNYTRLQPKTRMPVRWSSDYEMLKRYFELIDIVKQNFQDDVDLNIRMPSADEHVQLNTISDQLRDFESVSKELQRDPTPSISDVRAYFDCLMATYQVEIHLSPNAQIIHSVNFENGLLKILERRELEEDEEEAVKMFKLPDVAVADEEDANLPFTERALRRRKRHHEETQYDIQTIKLLPTTSNHVERLFSKVKHIWRPDRRAMSALNFEIVTFLKENRSLWDVYLVNQALVESDHRNSNHSR